MKKTLPEHILSESDKQSRMSTLRNWVLNQKVTEIEMTEAQFWNFAQLQPVAEKPWTTFMGHALRVPDMPVEAQKYLGICDKVGPGSI